MNKLLYFIPFLLLLSGMGFATNTYCVSLTTGNVCFNSSLMSGTKLNWSDVLNPPAALGGGTTIPISNVTNLAGSSQCSGTDRVSNVTVTNSGLAITCSSTGSGNGTTTTSLPIANITNLISSKTCLGSDKVSNVTINGSGIQITCTADANGTAGGITLPWSNITSFPGLTGLAINTNYTFPGLIVPWSNLTGVPTTIPFSNVTGFPGLTGLTLGTNYTFPGGTMPWANVTNFAGVTGLAINTNYTFPGLTLPQGNLTGSTYLSCGGTDKATAVNLTNGVINVSCAPDQTSAGGSGLVPAANVTAGTFGTGNFVFQNNATAQYLYGNLSWPNITAFPGLTGLAINTNYTFPGVTGLTLGTNYTFAGSTGLAINTNYTFPGLTGLAINTNYTFPGVSSIPAANLSNGSFPIGNWSFKGNLSWSNITFPGVTGLSIGTNYTFPGDTGLAINTNYTFPGLTGLAINTNYTFPGVTLPIANITAGSFGTGNWVFSNATNTNLTMNITTIQNGNATFNIPNGDTQVCFEKVIASTYNYTRCLNSTGSIIERTGIFAA